MERSQVIPITKNYNIMDKSARDNRANQMNPNHPAYAGGTVTHGFNSEKCYRDNRANQLNPNNPAYWSSRSGQAGGATGDIQGGATGDSRGWSCNVS